MDRSIATHEFNAIEAGEPGARPGAEGERRRDKKGQAQGYGDKKTEPVAELRGHRSTVGKGTGSAWRTCSRATASSGIAKASTSLMVSGSSSAKFSSSNRWPQTSQQHRA